MMQTPLRCRNRALAVVLPVLLGLPFAGCDRGVETAVRDEVDATQSLFVQRTPAEGAAYVAGDATAGAASSRPSGSSQPSGFGAAAQDQVAASRRTAIVTAAERAAPAVVSISVIRTERVRPRSLFESFMAPGLRRAPGFGSGFIIDAEGGVVLTNEHVVRDADRIMVTLSDGRDFDAELVGADELIDIAVLRIEADGLRAAPLGTSRGLITGEWAVAIGNPFGTRVSNTEPTVTAGVVSAVGRHIVPGSQDEGFYLGMIQTDASINPGNSGGPLVNAFGQVIGVNSSIFSRSGGSEGLGFAIPIDRALRAAEDILEFGEVRRAWVGLDVEPVEADAWGRTRGVRVSRVVPGSPAERAGITAGTRLLEAEGRRLTVPLDYEDLLLDLRPGDDISLVLEGRADPVVLEAQSLPERVTALRDLNVVTVTPDIQAERGLLSPQGAMIVDISPELASRLGFQPGDVIVRINNTPIRSAPDLAAFFDRLRGQGRISIYFERNGSYTLRQFYWSGG